MKSKKIILFDGQTLDKNINKYLYQFHISGEADIFAMSGSKFLLNFVGYIEFVQDNVLYELYCFPKEYNVDIDRAQVLPSTEVNSDQVKLISKQFKVVIESIRNANNSLNNVSQNDMSQFYTSNLYYLNEIIRHYNQYGVLVETEKIYKNAPSGKIKWNKTIGKIVPKRLNNNLVYDEFIIEKKNQNLTFLTKLIAKVIKEGTSKYSFYMDVIDTEIDYSEFLGISNKEAISRLYVLKNQTFKDYIHHVIDNLISYLENDSVSTSNSILVGTNNYNFVWEHVVAHALGSEFEKPKQQTIGKYYRHNTPRGENTYIQPDHLNTIDKIIVDSKYYNDREKKAIDHKQLFYNYHQVFLQMQDNTNLSYQDTLDENSRWKNVLIKPTSDSDYQFSVYALKDNMKLYSLKINATDYIEYYVTGKYKGKATYEISENFKLRNKIAGLNINIEQ